MTIKNFRTFFTFLLILFCSTCPHYIHPVKWDLQFQFEDEEFRQDTTTTEKYKINKYKLEPNNTNLESKEESSENKKKHPTSPRIPIKRKKTDSPKELAFLKLLIDSQTNKNDHEIDYCPENLTFFKYDKNTKLIEREEEENIPAKIIQLKNFYSNSQNNIIYRKNNPKKEKPIRKSFSESRINRQHEIGKGKTQLLLESYRHINKKLKPHFLRQIHEKNIKFKTIT